MTTLPHTLLEQLGRHWADGSSIADWSFVEEAQTGGNIWACPLSELANREAKAASLTLVPTAPRQPGEGSWLYGVEVLVAAPTMRDALAVIADLAGVLFPSGLAFKPAATPEFPSGLIGIPQLAVGETAELWRVIEIQPDSAIVPVPGGRDDGSTDEGQMLARLDLRCRVTPYTYEEPQLMQP